MNLSKPDEMVILKAASIKVDDNHIMLATLQYHTERDPDTRKINRSKSRYRWLARIDTMDDYTKRMNEMKSADKCHDKWKWPEDPSWNGSIITTDSGNLVGSRWYNTKLKKAVDWDTGMKILNGYNRAKAVKDPAKAYNDNAKYDVEGYIAPDGTKVNITDKASVLKHVGHNLVKEQFLKCQLPKENDANAADSVEPESK